MLGDWMATGHAVRHWILDPQLVLPIPVARVHCLLLVQNVSQLFLMSFGSLFLVADAKLVIVVVAVVTTVASGALYLKTHIC